MNFVLIRHVFSFCFSFFLSFYIIPKLIKSSLRLGIMDVPDGKIKCHKAPTPYLGGVAIYLSFIATLCIVYPFENKIVWLLLGSTLLLLIGLIDDLHVLTPGRKFFGQIIATLCFLKGGLSLKSEFLSSFFNLFISGFWMLSVINAFNLVDVMDGLSSLIAMVSSLSFLIIAILFKQYEVSLLLTTFLGALAAFFVYNKPPAKIYMGDAGSMFLGGFLASIPLLFSWSSCSIDAYYAPVIILSIPLLEIFFLVLIRTLIGIPFYKGSPHHFSIYLIKKGWSKYQVLLFTLIMGMLFSGAAFLFLFKIVNFLMLVFILAFLFFIWSYFVFYNKKLDNVHNS
jgi:UDP-GlcNAc:undecaprenyl-phosphate/decaprenyl-phosphate GlcNAc-1-phosphate transferase